MTLTEYKLRYEALIDYYFDSLAEIEKFEDFVKIQHYYNDSLHQINKDFVEEFLNADTDQEKEELH